MKRQWQYFENPILNATQDSYRMAYKISLFHFNALNANSSNATIAAMLASYTPFHEALETILNEWIAQFGAQQGDTLNLNQNLRLLSGTYARQWDITIQQLYDKNSIQYKALLPDSRTPFQNGSQDQRMNAVKALSIGLLAYPPLAAQQTIVNNFYEVLLGIFNNQKTNKSSTTSLSDQVNTARIAMCEAQYANLGGIIQLYSATPDLCNQYFDEENIRAGQQVIFDQHVKPETIHFVVKHTFAATGYLKLENTGLTPLNFYLAATKNAPMGAINVLLAPGDEVTVYATSLGPVTNAFLQVYNPSATVKGAFSIDLNPGTPPV